MNAFNIAIVFFIFGLSTLGDENGVLFPMLMVIGNIWLATAYLQKELQQ